MLKYLFLSLTLLLATVLLASWFGVRHQDGKRDAMVEALFDSALKTPTETTDTAALPGPVRRYLQRVLPEHAAPIRTVKLQQHGSLKISPETAAWSSFIAEQSVSATAPGFIWDARVRVGPALHVRVRDAYLEHNASGEVSFLSLLPMGSRHGDPELNNGALFRYLAEAPWYPTRLLPGNGLSWQAVDDSRAIATLQDGPTRVSLEFRFNETGEITGIYTEARYGIFDNAYRQYPWEGKFGDYRTFDGVKVPTTASVGWHLPQGWWLFLTMQVDSVTFGRE